MTSKRNQFSLCQNNNSYLSTADTNKLIIIEDSGNDYDDSEEFDKVYKDLFRKEQEVTRNLRVSFRRIRQSKKAPKITWFYQNK